MLPVIEIILQFVTGTKLQLRCDSDVSTIEQRVHVSAKKQTVVGTMPPASTDRSNVSCLQYGQSFLLSDDTSPFVGIGHKHPEPSLTEPWSH